MTSRNGLTHVVVDGSNIATEGRSAPSLAQLNDAVMSFMEEHPDTAITVVVDATFGHRIDKKETAEFEAGISNNELVAPPAGAIGRGDAFVLSIAQKAKASILSNDSFQEFHADYGWLFDEGRLIGGKPVPHVGWVFVNRSPVRGPVSRKVMQGGRARGGSRRSDGGSTDRSGKAMSSGSPLANEPMPIPKTPPPGRSRASASKRAEAPSTAAPGRTGAGQPAPRAGEVVNELMPFLEFVEHHPVGTSVNGIVESYSSHGAYLSIGNDGVRGYIPLRLMADPPPASARKVMQIGEAFTVVVVSFAAPRRSIDCALPDMASRASIVADDSPTVEPVAKRAAKKTPAKKAPVKKAPAKKTPAKKPAAKSPAKKVAKPAGENTPAKKAAAKAPARRAAAKEAAAKQLVGERVSATKAAAAPAPTSTIPTKVPAKKSSPRKVPAKKSVSTTATAKKSATKPSVAKKSVATKDAGPPTTPSAVTPKKAVAQSAATAKRQAAKPAAARKRVAKDAPAKASAKRAAAAGVPVGVMS
jgi:Zc3h12a-like Ribonuclease NYN domain/S1 RNA binding domain